MKKLMVVVAGLAVMIWALSALNGVAQDAGQAHASRVRAAVEGGR